MSDITLTLTPVQAEALDELLAWEVGQGNPIYLQQNSPTYNALYDVFINLRLQGGGETVPRPRPWIQRNCAPL